MGKLKLKWTAGFYLLVLLKCENNLLFHFGRLFVFFPVLFVYFSKFTTLIGLWIMNSRMNTNSLVFKNEKCFMTSRSSAQFVQIKNMLHITHKVSELCRARRLMMKPNANQKPEENQPTLATFLSLHRMHTIWMNNGYMDQTTRHIIFSINIISFFLLLIYVHIPQIVEYFSTFQKLHGPAFFPPS